MTRLALLGASLLLLAQPVAGAAPALSPAASEAYQKLVAAMRAEISSPKAKPENLQGKKEFLASLPQFLDQPDSFDRMITQVGSTFITDATRNAAEKLHTLLADERGARAAADLKALQDRLQQVKDAILAAKAPADLDAAAELAFVVPPEKRGYPAPPEMAELTLQLRSAKRFIPLWQDYLFAKSTGDTHTADRTLETLIALAPEDSPIPRSRLMELQAGRSLSDEEAVRIVSGIKSLDEVREVLVGLRTASDQSRTSLRMELSRSLSIIESAYRRHLSGLPLNVGSYATDLDVETGPAAAQLSELKGQLLKLTLPRHLGAPTSLTARSDESFGAFLDRIVEDGKSRNDPSLAYRARQTKALLNRAEKVAPADTAGVTAYLAALTQAEAGQTALAVLSYQQALKSGSDLISAKAIGEQLESLRTAHPDDYRQGTDWFVQSQLPAPSPALPAQPPVIAPDPTPPAVVPPPGAQPDPPKEPAPAPTDAPEPPKQNTDGQ